MPGAHKKKPGLPRLYSIFTWHYFPAFTVHSCHQSYEVQGFGYVGRGNDTSVFVTLQDFIDDGHGTELQSRRFGCVNPRSFDKATYCFHFGFTVGDTSLLFTLSLSSPGHNFLQFFSYGYAFYFYRLGLNSPLEQLAGSNFFQRLADFFKQLRGTRQPMVTTSKKPATKAYSLATVLPSPPENFCVVGIHPSTLRRKCSVVQWKAVVNRSISFKTTSFKTSILASTAGERFSPHVTSAGSIPTITVGGSISKAAATWRKS